MNNDETVPVVNPFRDVPEQQQPKPKRSSAAVPVAAAAWAGLIAEGFGNRWPDSRGMSTLGLLIVVMLLVKWADRS